MPMARAPNGGAPVPAFTSIWNCWAAWTAAVVAATVLPKAKSAMASATATVTWAIVAAVRRLRRSVLRTPMRAGPERTCAPARIWSSRPVP